MNGTAAVYGVIHDAIVNKKVIRAIYNAYGRVMCPHLLGTKNGRAQALFYQFAGHSSSGIEPDGSSKNWRCMFLDELSNVQSEDGTWHTAPNHSRPSTCVDTVAVEVEF